MPRKMKITSPDGKTLTVTAPDEATDEELMQFAQQHLGNVGPQKDSALPGTTPIDYDALENPVPEKPGILGNFMAPIKQAVGAVPGAVEFAGNALTGLVSPRHAEKALADVGTLAKGVGQGASNASKELWDKLRDVTTGMAPPIELAEPVAKAGTLGMASPMIEGMHEAEKEGPGAIVARLAGEAALMAGPSALGKLPVKLRPGSPLGTAVKVVDRYGESKGFGAFDASRVADYEGEIARALKSGEINLKQATKLRKEAAARPSVVPGEGPIPLTVSERAAPNSPAQLKSRPIEASVQKVSGKAQQARADQAVFVQDWRNALVGKITPEVADLETLQADLSREFRAIHSRQKSQAWAEMSGAMQQADKQLGKPSVRLVGIKDSVLQEMGDDFISTGGLAEPFGGLADQTLKSVGEKLKTQAVARGSAELTIEEAHALSRELRERVSKSAWKGKNVSPQEAQYMRYTRMLDNSIDAALEKASPEVQTAFRKGKDAYAATKTWHDRTYIREIINSGKTKNIAAALVSGTAEDVGNVMSQLPKRRRNAVRGALLEDTLQSATQVQEGIGKLSGTALKEAMDKRFSSGRLEAMFTPLERAEIKQFVDTVGRIEARSSSADVGRAALGINLPAAGLGVASVMGGGPVMWLGGAVGGPLLTNRVLAHLMFTPGGSKSLRGVLDVMRRAGSKELTPELLSQIQKGAYGSIPARYAATIARAQAASMEEDEAGPVEDDGLALFNSVMGGR